MNKRSPIRVLVGLKYVCLLFIPGLLALLSGGISWNVVVLTLLVLPGSGRFLAVVTGWLTVCLLAYPFLVDTVGVENFISPALVGVATIAIVAGVSGWLTEARKEDSLYRLFSRMDWGHVRSLYLVASVVFLVGALHRSTVIVDQVCMVILALGIFWAIPQGPRKAREYASDYGLLFFSVIFGYLLIEVGVRYTTNYARAYGHIIEVHPDYIFLLKPYSKTTMELDETEPEELEWEVEISSQGFRDREFGPKGEDEFRILALGDSFTMGHGPVEDSIPHQLNVLMAEQWGPDKVTVINGGIGGSGPVQQYGQFMERGLALDPDLVVLQLYPPNDVNDMLAVYGDHLEAYSRERFRSIRRMDLEANNFWTQQCEAALRKISHVYLGLVIQNQNATLLVDWLVGFRFVPITEEPEAVFSARRNPYMELGLEKWYPELDEAFSMFGEHILKFKKECDSRGIPFAAYVIPARFDLKQSLYQRQQRRYGDIYAFSKTTTVSEKLLNDLGIDSFSVRDALGRIEDISDIYYLSNGHLNGYGNNIVASAMMRHIEERNLIE